MDVLPGWDSDAVFSALIGGAGGYAITPIERFVWGGYYEPSSLIWRNRWVTVGESVIECREALVLPARPDRAVVLRRLTAQRNRAHVEVMLNPRASFGADSLGRLRRDDAGTWRGRVGALHMTWGGGARAVPESDGHRGKTLRMPLDLDEGEHHDLVLVLALDQQGAQPPDPGEAWSATETAWRERVPDARGHRRTTGCTTRLRRPYRIDEHNRRHGRRGDHVPPGACPGRSQLRLPLRLDPRPVLRGPGGSRRGTATVSSTMPCASSERPCARTGAHLKPAYTAAGNAVPEERRLDLPGYPGTDDVVTGNQASSQFQLDAFGEALLLFAAAAGHDRLEPEGWHAAEIAAGAIADRWHEPDAGIWELDPDTWTHSRLICAAGLRAISSRVSSGEGAARWLALADAITADAAKYAVHASGRWQRSPSDERIDASLLLSAIRGAVPADDPRSLATLRAVLEELTEDGYAYRYRPDERSLGEAEGAFLLCGFMLSLALKQQRNEVSAIRWFERTRAASGPPGLLSEEFDVTQRQLRGNLPQAFVHALLLECSVVLYSSSSSSGSGLGMSSSSGG